LRRFLVDTNVIIDVLSRDARWYAWSAETIVACADLGPLAINPIIFAELSVGFQRIEDLDGALPEADWQRLPLPWSAGFLAGRCFVDYRRRGGSRVRPLPDFYIGAHAAVENLALITRDVSRFRTYFPTVELIAPEGAQGHPGADEAP
jgi:predicted nucleic acid-binding protein